MLLFQYSSQYPWELLQRNGNRSVVFVGFGGEQGRKKARKKSLKVWVLQQ